MMGRRSPPYNHTRADGPYDPCPVCLRLMGKKALRSLVGDLQETGEDSRREEKKERARADVAEAELRESAVALREETTDRVAAEHELRMAQIIIDRERKDHEEVVRLLDERSRGK